MEKTKLVATATAKMCGNCKNCLPINKHPWNLGLLKGNISDIAGYGCTIMQGRIVIFDDQYGLCEMWEDKK